MLRVERPMILGSVCGGRRLSRGIVDRLIENMCERMISWFHASAMLNNMFATKVSADWFRRVHFHLSSDEAPPFSVVVLGTCHLKIVDIHAKQETQLRMPKH